MTDKKKGGILADQTANKRDERVAFLILAVFLAPILTVIIVGGYGFIVWITQLLTGPPGA
ncbi:periplasmic nitrate reductase, NapE protein [Exilibacterium tricleocarpae]|uniref:periplasmic nitrate reductase, NapE protein n=1 Tax=Exilibacterium tricleocarpae TaxID=2591008 RepID=UPI003CCC867A